jgi:exonuclease III
LKIASWNDNSIQSRIGHVTESLNAHQPDVLLLQELKGSELQRNLDKLPVEESQKSRHKKESHQRDSEGNGKSITKTLDPGYFLPIAAQHGANEGHSQARKNGTKQ